MTVFTNQIFLAGGEGVNAEGGIVAVIHRTNNNNFNSSSNIARDNSAPSISEGIEIFSVTHALSHAGNKLLFISDIYGNEDSNSGDNLVFPHFAGNTCFFVGFEQSTGTPAGENYRKNSQICMYEPNTTSSVSYSIRGGVDSGNFEHMESTDYSQNSYYATLRRSTLTIMEISSS
tara:strand:+ start:85 stop:609 length:525 start_codon:yes stop_codon:yes gene_type:complete